MALGMQIVSDTARLAPMNWNVKLELLYICRHTCQPMPMVGAQAKQSISLAKEAAPKSTISLNQLDRAPSLAMGEREGRGEGAFSIHTWHTIAVILLPTRYRPNMLRIFCKLQLWLHIFVCKLGMSLFLGAHDELKL